MKTGSLLDNRYRILHSLREGGFSHTFVAEDTKSPTNRRCVVKQLKPIQDDPTTYELVKERFLGEAKMLEDLGQQNTQIPDLYAYFEVDSEFYLVQQLIEGQTLDELIEQRGPLSEDEVKKLLLKILPVLEFIHSRKIIHRDIKPSNIIVRREDQLPVLIDFGAVREAMGTVAARSGSSVSSIVIGTNGYMPSEQAAGRAIFASDLYALGLTMIYALTGKGPQELLTDPETGDILWRGEALGVSPLLTPVLDQAIQFQARDRFRTARQMLDTLQESALHPEFSSVFSPSSRVVTSTPKTQISRHPGISSQPPTTVAPSINSSQPTAVGPSINWGPLLAVVVGLGTLGGGAAALITMRQAETETADSQTEETSTETELNANISESESEQRAQETTDRLSEEALLQKERELALKEKEIELAEKQRELEAQEARQRQQTAPAPPPVRQSQPVARSNMPFRSACGSPPGSGSVWYAVVGNRGALSVVKNNYCGDAYARADGTAQVASFTSRSQARNFANALKNETGYSFWVKDP